MADVLVPDDFRALDAPLQVEVGSGSSPATLDLTVDSVKDLPTHRLRAEPFAVILRGPRAPLLAQATYALRHPRLGAIPVFLVPVGQGAEATLYEATFN